MCLPLKTWNLIEKPPYQSLTFTQECSFKWKNSFFVAGQQWCKVTFFEIGRLKLQNIKIVLVKWNGKLIAVSYMLKKLC